MDFTISKYIDLIDVLIKNGYSFQTFHDFMMNPLEKVVVLRHDVDALPKNSLNFAKIQEGYGIKGTYFFRAVKQSWDEDIIKEIHSLGHEVGYHYENLTTCNGDMDKAIRDFEHNLLKLRRIVEVSTICMHGSPLSKYDSKDLWEIYDYKSFDVIGEPYFDVDFNEVLYLTDTGRTWNGESISVRDKVNSNFDFTFQSTEDIINAANSNKLPNQIMYNFHPQRWHENHWLWVKELLFQSMKNKIKKMFFVKPNKSK